MESIGKHLESWKRRVGFQEMFEKTKQEIINDPLVMQIMEKFELDEKTIEPYLNEIQNVRVSHSNCKTCKGISECSNQMRGHKTHIVKHNGEPLFTNKPCNFFLEEQERKKQQNMVKSYFVSDELRDISFNDIDIKKGEDKRFKTVQFLTEYAKNVVPGEEGFGIYLYGYFGSGKTFMMWALMNYLSKNRGISSIIVYVPDFVRELKSSFGDNGIDPEEKIRAIKDIPILVLDDIGSDYLTPWIRDEVLGPVLQHRVNAKLPTLYTANKSLKDLKDFLSYTDKGKNEELKASRIMERIENYSNVFHIEDVNRRKEWNQNKLIRVE